MIGCTEDVAKSAVDQKRAWSSAANPWQDQVFTSACAALNEADHHRPGSVLELADAKWSRAAYSYEVNEARRQMTPLDTAG